MYNDYFGLEYEPFSVTPDPDFFFYAEQYKEAMAHLLYGVQERRGLLLLTGRVGSGKTTLCRTLVRELDEKTHSSFLRGSFESPREILRALVRDFNVNVPENASREELYSRLEEFLLDGYEQGYNACVIVDESQNLSVEVLEQLRLLSNLETDKNKLLQIVLVGQPELETLLNESTLRQLKQRISIRAYLSHLDEGETREYVEHRLERAAGGSPDVSIQSGVYRLLYEASEGNPRVINRLADRMLLAAYVDESSTVRKEHLHTALDDLSSEANEVDKREGLILRKMKSWFESSGGFLNQLSGAGVLRTGVVSMSALLTVLLGTVLFGGWFGSWSNPTIISPNSRETAGKTSSRKLMTKTKESKKTTAIAEMVREGDLSDTLDRDRSDTIVENTQPSGDPNREGDESPAESSEPSADTVDNRVQVSPDTSPGTSDIANPLALQPFEVDQLNSDTLTLTLNRSFNRYISFITGNKDISGDSTLTLSESDSPARKIRKLLPSDSPVIQLVEVEGTYSELREFSYPFFPLTNENPRRYLLSLPETENVWDPTTGWIAHDQVGIDSGWEGKAQVLAPAPFELSRLRSFQDTGASIVRLQELLNGTGEYDIPLVGNYGPLTRRSIRDFQQRNDLLSDGVGGPKTYLTLLKENNVRLQWTEDRIRRFLE